MDLIMLEIRNLSKTFGKEEVLSEMSFDLPLQSVLSILGRSGSGKTTLLKIVAGLEEPSSGDIFWKGKRMNDIAANKRKIVYLYQEALLFPHLDIFENIAFGLRLTKEKEAVIKEKAGRILESLGLSEQARKFPHQLSGGQKQRVSFGRALIINPPLMLLDEPFGALDVETRRQMQDLFLKIVDEFEMTAIFVTHDLKEAISIGHKIGHLKKGKLSIYEELSDFLEDPSTEAGSEIAFWSGMKDKLSNSSGQ